MPPDNRPGAQPDTHLGADDIRTRRVRLRSAQRRRQRLPAQGGEPADLIHAIRVIAAGEALLAPRVTRRLIDSYITTAPPAAQTEHDGLEELTNREREVLGLVATGLTNAEVAQQLHLSPLTAKTHVSRILMKLGARDRVQLVVIAYRTGMIDQHPSQRLE